MDTGFAPRSLLRRMGSGVAALLVALTTLTVLVVAPSPAHAAPSSDEQAFLDQTNATRAQNGLGPLQWDEGEANIARSWSSQMAGSQTLSHNPNLVAQTQAITPDWQRVGENVGFGPTVDALQNAFVNSPPHFANIVGDYNRVGIGVVRDGNNTIWVTLDFVKGPDLAPPPPPPTPTWFLRDTLTTGVADSSFLLGDWGDKVISCDWNGDGTDTPGIFRNGQWYYTNQLGSGGILTFSFGSPGDVPVCGDWDGNGTDTPGVFRNGMFFLRNSNSSGVADLSFPYGSPGDLPVVGDWNGDGKATVGIYRNGWFYLTDNNSAGYASMVFPYGNPGDRPLAGDWDGNGADSIGIWRNGALYLHNQNSSGYADFVFAYGNPGDAPIIGDWNNNGTDKLGVVRGGS